MRVGEQIAAIDSRGHILPGVIAPVPREWRDKSGSLDSTTLGAFPKVWVKFVSRPGQPVVPWPIEAIAVTVTDAERLASEQRRDKS